MIINRFSINANNNGLSVLVSVSNYNLRPSEGLPNMDQAIPMFIRSFSKGGDYHPLSRDSHWERVQWETI
jgi:hypothetical protein